MNSSKSTLFAGLCSLTALLLASTSATAANITWSTTSGTWDTSATNWTGASGTPWDSTNGVANTAVLAAASSATISDSVYANGITINPSLGGSTISGGTLNLTGMISQLDSANTLTISSALLGSAGMVKEGVGTLVLSGNNVVTGTTTIQGGALVLDYSGLTNSASPLSSSASVNLNMATLEFHGKTSGTTTQSLTTLNLGTNGAIANTLYLNSNGGSGIALTSSTLGAGNTSNLNLIDLSSSASNSLVIGKINSTSWVVANGILTANTGSGSIANVVVRDSTGYGFATLSGATSGTIGRLKTGTTLNASNSSDSTNYFLTTAGTVTRTANLALSTLTIDSTAGAITLDMGTYNILPGISGRGGILVTGANDVNISGSGRVDGTYGHLSLFNYSSGTLTIGLSMDTATGAGSGWSVGGTGLTVWTGTDSNNGQATSVYVEGGIFRIATAQNLTTYNIGARGGMYVSSGGILEIGADLNGATAGDFSNTVGSAAGNVRFYGNAGVSASGANRTVNFGGSGATLTWGSSYFLTDAGGTGDGNYTFLLSSAKSDATVTVQNKIALGSFQRTVQVADGSAAIDAVLGGILSGAGGLTKTGLGTLALTANNTYTGATLVNAGELDVNGSIASGAVSVSNGATLGGSGTVSGSVTGTDANISGNGLSLGATTLDGTSRISGTNTASSITVRSGTTTASGVATTNTVSVAIGATMKNTGVLGATSATVTVNNGATLTNNGTVEGTVNVSGTFNGNGAVTGSLSIKSGGDLAPGNSPGTTTVNGSLTVEGGAKVSLQIDKATPADGLVAGEGGNYDQIIVNGTVTLGLNSVLDFTSLNNAKAGDVFSLILNDGTDAIDGVFTTVQVNGVDQHITNNSFTLGGLTYDLSYTANADGSGVGTLGNDLTLTVVPEPSTWAIVVGGMGLLVVGQRLRRGKNT